MNIIYLDHASTTPICQHVEQAMISCMRQRLGNPQNETHEAGRAARRGIDAARVEIAQAIGADPTAIVFTSGATESNNLAILGFAARRSKPGHVVTCAIEHRSVLEPCRALESAGWRVTHVGTDSTGRIDLDCLADALDKDAQLLSIQWVNNEIGTIQPIEEIARMAQQRGVCFHTDATQAIGRLPVNVTALGIDLLSFSGHKIYGPTGTGVLFVRDPTQLSPRSFGGGQEVGLRSGTHHTPGIVGLGVASRIAIDMLSAEAIRLTRLTHDLRERLITALPDTCFLTPQEGTVPGLISMGWPGIEAETLMLRLEELAISSGAACHDDRSLPSHVVVALDLPPQMQLAPIRISMGRDTTQDHIDLALQAITREVKFLQSLGSTRNIKEHVT